MQFIGFIQGPFQRAKQFNMIDGSGHLLAVIIRTAISSTAIVAVVLAHLRLPVHVVQSPQVDDLCEQWGLDVVGAGLLQQGELGGQCVVVLALLALQARFHVKDLLRGQHSHAVHKFLDEPQGVDVVAVLLEGGQGSVLVRSVIIPDVGQ